MIILIRDSFPNYLLFQLLTNLMTHLLYSFVKRGQNQLYFHDKMISLIISGGDIPSANCCRKETEIETKLLGRI